MGLFPLIDPFSREVRAENMEEFCLLAHSQVYAQLPA